MKKYENDPTLIDAGHTLYELDGRQLEIWFDDDLEIVRAVDPDTGDELSYNQLADGDWARLLGVVLSA